MLMNIFELVHDAINKKKQTIVNIKYKKIYLIYIISLKNLQLKTLAVIYLWSICTSEYCSLYHQYHIVQDVPKESL